MEARDAAKALIRQYVERGDSYQSLKESLMGRYGSDYRAGIGVSGGSSTCAPKNSDSITVTWLEGNEVCQHFSLKQLFDEIKNGNNQPRLF